MGQQNSFLISVATYPRTVQSHQETACISYLTVFNQQSTRTETTIIEQRVSYSLFATSVFSMETFVVWDMFVIKAEF